MHIKDEEIFYNIYDISFNIDIFYFQITSIAKR